VRGRRDADEEVTGGNIKGIACHKVLVKKAQAGTFFFSSS
jgi:hypothetical protein